MKEQSQTRSMRLSEPASFLLDVVRLSAALMVVVAHLTHEEFHLGYRDQQVLGDIAVPVFFVLSGFVIRYVTKTRETTAREYFIDRASRIYSVVLPAMVFTLLVSAVCFAINRGVFLRDWAQTFDHPMQRIVFNLLFVSQAWGHNTIPFIDSPFWSLGYECVYYVLYGLLFFFRGWKRVAGCLVVALVVGPQVLFLLPVWWSGCWLYDIYVASRTTRWGVGLLVVCGACLALLLTSALPGVSTPVAKGFWGIATARSPLELAGQPVGRATMFAVAVGIAAFVGMLALLLATDALRFSGESRWAKGFRRLADGTFAIYLMHYPFLVLLLFLGAIRTGHTVSNGVVATLMCLLLVVSAVPMDVLKVVFRRRLRTWFSPDSV